MKPSKNHPWRRLPFKVSDWAKDQSTIRNVTNVVVARPQTLARRDDKRQGQN